MRMYEIWKMPTKPTGEPSRLEDAGGPVLFPRECDAKEYSTGSQIPTRTPMRSFPCGWAWPDPDHAERHR